MSQLEPDSFTDKKVLNMWFNQLKASFHALHESYSNSILLPNMLRNIRV